MVGSPHNALRRQTEALNLMLAPKNFSYRNAGTLLNISHRALRRWKRHFDLFGEAPATMQHGIEIVKGALFGENTVGL